MVDVHIVGAGPGDPELITRKGYRLVQEADVVIYAGSLVNPAILEACKPGCEIHNSATMNLDEVLAVMKASVEAGKSVVRLHTGDPAIYGAIQEQMDALAGMGISYEVVPGVSSFLATAAALKQEYTELLEKSGNSLTLSNYELSRLINLEITSLKSLFSAKVLEAENLGIKVNLELPDVISSTQIEALDLVVISSVFLNNAIESAVDSEDPTLTISFFKNQGYLILVIDNTTREERIPVSRIFDEGVLAKVKAEGLVCLRSQIYLIAIQK